MTAVEAPETGGPPAGPLLRPAGPGDVEALHALLLAAGEAGEVIPPSLPSLRRRVGEFLVACLDGRVVGCIALRPQGRGAVELASLAVDRGHRRQGLSKLLASEALRRLGPDLLVFYSSDKPEWFEDYGFVPLHWWELPPFLPWWRLAAFLELPPELRRKVARKRYRNMGRPRLSG